MIPRDQDIHLADDLSVPLNVMTETIAILGIRGSGKTTTAVVLTEELLTLGQQVVIIDPTDVWWGLRSSKDGSSPAFSIPVFGGRHGDVPLTGDDGKTIADLLVDERIPAILSLRHLESQADQRRFVTEFAKRLYHRKGETGQDTPLLLIIDEAHLFVPQAVAAAVAPMVGAIQKLVRQGRSSGIGVAIIDQRAASVNKDVLTQLELLIAHRSSSPQDSKALDAWVKQHDAGGRRDTFLTQLASLPRGTAWMWSPNWLDIFQKVAVRDRKTFDSSATPTAGMRTIASPSRTAEIDVSALRLKLASSIAVQDENDPKKLKHRIAELERLAGRTEVNPEPVRALQRRIAELEATLSLPREPREVPVLSLPQAEMVYAVATAMNEMSIKLLAGAEDLRRSIERHQVSKHFEPPHPTLATATARTPSPVATASLPTSSSPPEKGSGARPAGETTVLIAIAQHRAGVSREQLTVLTGYKRSTRDTYLQRLKAAGLIDQVGDAISVTNKGERSLPSDFEPLPTGVALREHWLQKLPAGESAILRYLVGMHPDAIVRSSIDHQLSFARSSRDTYLQRLKAKKLIVVEGATVRASKELF